MTHQAIIGIGANIGDTWGALRQAVIKLHQMPCSRVLRVSPVYASAPMEVNDAQPDYLNAAACIETALSPFALLDAVQAIEDAAGRVRPYWHAPRVLDLDILLYGDAQVASERLTIPHPRLTARAFALLPLIDVSPDARIPGIGRAADQLPGVAAQDVRRLGAPIT